MKGPLDLVAGALADPVPTLRQAAEEARLPLPLAIAAAALAVAGLAAMRGPIGLLWMGFGLAGLFFLAAVLQLTADLLGGRGTGRGLLAALALAQTPALLTAPVAALGLVPSPSWLGAALRAALGLWTVVLEVLAVREAHRLSTGRALAVMLLPVVALLLLALLVLGAVVWMGPGVPDLFFSSR